MLQEQTGGGKSSGGGGLSHHLSRLRVGPAKSASDKTKAGQAVEGGGGGASERDHNNSDPSSKSSMEKSAAASTPTIPDEVKLPQSFQVKYLGKREARGLWGIKHTRKPVDDMVAGAR